MERCTEIRIIPLLYNIGLFVHTEKNFFSMLLKRRSAIPTWEIRFCAAGRGQSTRALLNRNSSVPNASFLYPLKTEENLTVFLCFQGVEE